MRSSLTAYGVSLAAVAVAAVARLLLDPLLADRLPFITLFFAVGFAAWYGGQGPGLMALVSGAVAAAFFLIQPRYSFAIDQSEFQVGIVLYGVVGFASIALFESLRKAHRQAAEQAERLRTTLASIGDAFVATDLDGRVTNMNAVAEELTGWTTGEAMGQPLDAVFRIVNETSRRTVENPVTRALREGVIVGLANHTVLIAKDGTERPIDDSAAPIRCKDGEIVGCVLVFRDIIERHRHEAELKAQERQFHTLSESISQLAWMANSDGHIFWYNRRWYEYTGTTLEQMEGWGWQSSHDPNELPKVLERWSASIATGTPFEMTFPLKRHDGQFRTFLTRVEPVKDEEGRVVRWFGTNTDITEQKKAEAAMRISEIRYRRLFEAARDGVLILDGRTGQITDANPYMMEVLGRTHADVLGRELWEIGVFTDATESRAVMAELQTRGYVRYDDLPLESKSGQRREVEVVANVYQENGQRVIQCNIRDITERKKLQDELKGSADELQKFANALSESDRRKNEFIATLAHELRNPLAPIRNGLQLIKLSGANGTVERARSMMERQVTQLVRLVDDLLDVSRITRGKIELRRERVGMQAVIDAAVETSHPLIEQAGHELVVTVPDEPIFVDGDATRLAQVVLNLLTNSAKYTHRGGHIRLTVRRDGEAVAVSVADDGIGIPPAMLDKVFVMFAQVDRTLEKTTGGLGIGLSLVKGLVEMHGGTIEARSEGEGKGSEFVVRLPVAVPVADGPDATNGQADEVVPSGRRRVLVVDDNADAADSLGQLLEMLGNEVRTAYDGEAGVGQATEFRPDVVLMDIGMPKLNGYEACRRIREQPWAADMVLVALTGWGQEDDRQKSADAGFDHHLVKPVDPQALMKMLAGCQRSHSERGN